MGHYDSAFAHDDEERRKARLRRLEEASKLMQQAREKLAFSQVPTRINDKLDDVQCYLRGELEAKTIDELRKELEARNRRKL
jgi:sugar phosphate isomerase/epimerase